MLEMVWVDSSGRHWKVCDMETRHIVNCIRLIERRGGWRRRYLDRLQLELDIRARGLSSRRADA